MKLPLLVILSLATPVSYLHGNPGDFPIVPEDVEVSLYAREPLVRNPCAIAFDAKGRLCVGMGPQYRSPKPDTPGDSVWILIDEDQDGTADTRKRFATGFNCIQGLAWNGGDLWVGNAPDLTVVRDLDGDDEADEYIRVYTDLGNLEHGVHGLNFAPDGKLYLSKGNSKGLTQLPDRLAPKPFRELWGVVTPEGTPDFPAPVVFTKENYEKNYHSPSDDWGLSGGVLRCDPDGSNLEIVSRGFRNPWDICFDDAFTWLGTDNDQTLGDKIFSPFFGANFGWGHPWSFDWEGNNHLPSAPAAGPLFEGSGTGVIYLGLDRYPDRYRGTFLINDWLRREVYIYRPQWQGAWMRSATREFEIFAHAGGGRSMDRSEGRSFDPVDVEIGPDEAVYFCSWGRTYGLDEKDGKQVNEGRIYRMWPKSAPPVKWSTGQRDPWQDLGSHLPAWRTNAQNAIVKQGAKATSRLKEIVADQASSTRLQTWATWAFGRIAPYDASVESLLSHGSLNVRVQALRILATRNSFPEAAVRCLTDAEPRVRHEAILALRQTGDRKWNSALLEMLSEEQDRIVFYSAWGALRDLLNTDEKKQLLTNPVPGIRRAALLCLLEDDLLTENEIAAAANDSDTINSALATRRSGGKAEGVIKGPGLVIGMDGSPKDAGDAPEAMPASVVADLQSNTDGKYEQALLLTGTKAYTDRRYRFTSVPDALEGLTFIRTANDDADAEEGAKLQFTLRYDSTVYFANDLRGEGLPLWARGKFEPTNMTLATNDAKHRVHQAIFKADTTLEFGPNRAGTKARKSQYIIVIQPELLKPPDVPATVGAAIRALPNADPDRGRTLFLSKNGATCARCHRLENIGNIHAPDLSDIGTRADANVLVKAILEPSAEITEGFAMQLVNTKNGTAYGGIVLQETGRALTLAMVDGSVVRVPTDDIVLRDTAPVSAMPATFGAMLTPQQIADITSYLLEQKQKAKQPEREEPRGVAERVEPLSGKAWGDPANGFRLACYDDRIDVAHDGQAIATYYFAHPQTRRPFFAHVKTLDGIQVTRNFPPIEGVDPTDHASMHPGISYGYAVLNGDNFWHNDRGVVTHERFTATPRATGDVAEFSVKNRYTGTDKSIICVEEANYRFTINEDGYLIAMSNQFSSDQEFYFGVREEMGLAIRVASPIRVRDAGGSILSASGGKNEEGTWGRVDRWWDYFGSIDGRSVGLQVMSGNAQDVWSHSRDYGVLVANPFPLDNAENKGKRTPVRAGDTFSLKFAVQVHSHAQRVDFDPKKAFERYSP